ncbi:hypothetical protein DRP53_02255 [candidate division WOR-3 bacterium]|uniref:CheW-like domain-containing protein n=1 Tax=candidate division WOR-3 bacterium TaxID=2052148 RepID=A0A660SL91_UNCW3|nr:MAG: hypothetical protein DRP53_02255 [candidate division WOR-3 bacterium]
MRFLTFFLGDLNLALRIEEVEGVVEEVNPVPIPKAPKHVVGIANIRNRIVPLISLPHLLNQELKVGKKWIIILSGEDRFLCEVDDIGEVVDCDEIRPTRDKSGLITGLIEKGKSTFLVIDPGRLTRR